MFKYIAFMAFLCLSATLASAQIFSGTVLENKTRIALSGVQIQNLNTKQTATTNNQGKFSINAKKGDLLTFRTFSYHPDTLLLTDLHEQEIFLTPEETMLNGVNVTTTTTKNANGALYHDKDYHGQSMVKHVDAKGNYDGGITLRMWYWKKQEKREKKLADQIQRDKDMDEIVKVFSPENISKYLPLKGDDMDAFIIRYIPDVSVYKSPGFNLLVYLNTCYKQFNALSPEERKPQRLQ